MKTVYGFVGLAMLASSVAATADTAPSTSAASSATPVDAVVTVHTSSPVFVTGKLLQQMCSADEKTSNGQEVCKDYLAGVVDTIVSNRDTIQGYSICWPKPAPDLSDLRVMLVKTLNDHPELLEGVGASIIDGMLFNIYRCPGVRAPTPEQFLHKN